MSISMLVGVSVCAALFALAGVRAEPMGPGITPNTPVIPGTSWRVHDGKRPQPRAVKASGAVVAAAPADAVVLFDGKSAEHWRQANGDDCPWTVHEGYLIAGGCDVFSREEFSDCQVHLEWRIPGDRKVDGQAGGNSGIFLMDRYEVQILQSFDNPTYADGTAGAVYGQTPPLVNATLPQGEWQSYDIIFTAPRFDREAKLLEPARVTVLHNGIVVQNATAILGTTVFRALAGYGENHPAKAPIRLQWHGDPVEYRNIWVRDLGGAAKGADGN